MRKTALFLTVLMLCMTAMPLVAAATTETQFSDGTTNFTHQFSQQGSTPTPGVNMPYGARVTGANFNVMGTSSGYNWDNVTSDADFGGAGAGSRSWTGSHFNWYRNSVTVENDEVSLTPMATVNDRDLSSTSHLDSSSTTVQNTTGAFASSGDLGFLGAKKTGTHQQLSSGNWNYPGVTFDSDERRYVAMYSGSSLYTVPTIQVYNDSTNVYIGTATVATNSCNSNSLYTFYDGAEDNGTLWAISYSYRIISKWTVSGSSWSCDQSWSFTSSFYYPMGISIDPTDGQLYLLVRDSSGTTSYNVWKVGKSSPTTATATYYLGSSSTLPGTLSGLAVQMPRMTVNRYSTSQSTHYVFHYDQNWMDLQGEFTLSSKGHYGLTQGTEGHLTYSCFYRTYCSSHTRKVLYSGSSTTYDDRTASSTAAVARSTTITVSSSVTEVSLSGAMHYAPTGTSVEYALSNDDGSTWISTSVGNTVTFAIGGTQIVWKAWLNSTNTSIVPVLDQVQISYVASYNSNGYIRAYKYYNSGNAPVAAQVWWNGTSPGSSYFNIYWQDGNGATYQINNPGTQTSFNSPSGQRYYYLYFYLYSGTGNADTPILEDINVKMFTNAPRDVKIDIGDDGSNEWTYTETLLGTTGAGGANIINALNAAIPDTGSGTVLVPITLKSGAIGQVEITSFTIDYVMQTVNLDMNWDTTMVFHERTSSYEVITRHVIGENSQSIQTATLDFFANPSSDAPSLVWSHDGSLVDDDPEDWIVPDAGATWTNNSNGIFEIHWIFRITNNFPEQEDVGFRVSCTDDLGNTPEPLSIPSASILVNQSYGLGWLDIRDMEGEVTWEDTPDGAWVAAGETIHFQGAMWFSNTEDSPLNSAFDVQIAQKSEQGDFVEVGWKDTNNPDGSFFISLQMPNVDVAEGITYEVQTYNERDQSRVLPIDSSWQRTYRIDATAPDILGSMPKEGAYEAAANMQPIRIDVVDATGQPEVLTLHYWVEADDDTNRNGQPDMEEYRNLTMSNSTVDERKQFVGIIDDTRNPNMASVSYYVTGTDPAGNPLTTTSGPGFGYDLATYRTRKDMESLFTGLDWLGHSDGETVYAGEEQLMTVGLVDANGLIDFEEISLVFDFEGPDPERDQQRISYSGVNDSFWTEGADIELLSTRTDAKVLTNNTGLPWILIDFRFAFGWDWPDEDISDVALIYDQLGSSPINVEFMEHTFRVENDLVLDAAAYSVTDVSEPRTGPVDDATTIRPDDRLAWSGRVVYEGSNRAPPNNIGIEVEVFDGVQSWSDGSLSVDGEFYLEVPLVAAAALASAETRTFLTGIRHIPGRGEDMTRNTVSTTLQLSVDHSPPRVLSRIAPIDIIDLGNKSLLSALPVEFIGTEECVNQPGEEACADFAQSPQFANWVMRDGTTTIAAGMSQLSLQVVNKTIRWSGTVDLTNDGIVTPRSGFVVGFWMTGHDAAGNAFPQTGNTESDPVREPANLDNDLDLAWVTLGSSESADLRIEQLVSDSVRVSAGTPVELVAYIRNVGGPLNGSFSVAFFAGDSTVPFKTVQIDRLEESGSLAVQASWKAEEGVDRLRVVADADFEVDEVDEQDNSMSIAVDVAYPWGFGWVEAGRQNPLTVLLLVGAAIVLPIVAVVVLRSGGIEDEDLFDDLLFDEEDELDEDEEEDEGWE
jgi:hypothetical protein